MRPGLPYARGARRLPRSDGVGRAARRRALAPASYFEPRLGIVDGRTEAELARQASPTPETATSRTTMRNGRRSRACATPRATKSAPALRKRRRAGRTARHIFDGLPWRPQWSGGGEVLADDGRALHRALTARRDVALEQAAVCAEALPPPPRRLPLLLLLLLLLLLPPPPPPPPPPHPHPPLVAMCRAATVAGVDAEAHRIGEGQSRRGLLVVLLVLLVLLFLLVVVLLLPAVAVHARRGQAYEGNDAERAKRAVAMIRDDAKCSPRRLELLEEPCGSHDWVFLPISDRRWGASAQGLDAIASFIVETTTAEAAVGGDGSKRNDDEDEDEDEDEEAQQQQTAGTSATSGSASTTAPTRRIAPRAAAAAAAAAMASQGPPMGPPTRATTGAASGSTTYTTTRTAEATVNLAATSPAEGALHARRCAPRATARARPAPRRCPGGRGP